jgi:serine/threonine-protein kinase
MIGTGLGQFTITSHLGSGGMGDVYQATDARLGRDVAVKFLSEAFVHDSSRLARFQREARALAALNHPHVAAIYGLEEVGGRHFLVMELVRGATLATKLAGGRLSIDDTIRYGMQIADALAAAHASGIVHRDLKPGNIMVAKSGVKVLDFGLAKSTDGDETLTRTDAIMGTPAYMSPEQREGRACDARSDIYSFGLILLEMATSSRVADDDLNGMPAQLARVIHGCLERDPDARWQSAADIKRALGWVAVPVDAKERISSRALTWTALALIAGIVSGAAGFWIFSPAPTSVDRVMRFADSQSGPTAVTISSGFTGSDLALTPDGSGLVHVGNNGTQLFLRRIDKFEAVPIASGTDIRAPFVSPNGQKVGYFDYRTVMKIVPLSGGPSVTLPFNGSGGATWLGEDTIVAGGFSRGLRLVKVNDLSAPVELLISPDATAGEMSYLWPHGLPDGHSVLFTITAQTGGLDAARLAVFDTRTRKKTVILRGGSDARYVTAPRWASRQAPGYLVYVAQGALRAVPFDPDRLELRGQAVPVQARLVPDSDGSAKFATAVTGMLAYVDAPGSAPDAPQSVMWVDWSSGQQTPVGPAGPYSMARLSPKATKIALATWENGERSIRVLDVLSQVSVRLRLAPVRYTGEHPLVWLDENRIVFQGQSAEHPVFSMWAVAVDGTAAPEPVLDTAKSRLATSVSSDGYLVFNEIPSVTENNLDILRMKLDGSREVTPLLRERDIEGGGVVSPDRRWIAYECCSEAKPEIWVSPYPGAQGGHWQVSRGGGRRPSWSPDGDQLFFTAPDGTVMRAEVKPGSGPWKPVSPNRVLGPEFSRNPWLDVSPDGRRLLTLKPANPTGLQPPLIRFVQDWLAELSRPAQ